MQQCWRIYFVGWGLTLEHIVPDDHLLDRVLGVQEMFERMCTISFEDYAADVILGKDLAEIFR